MTIREDALDEGKAIAFGVCLVGGLRYVERLKVDAVGAVDEAFVARSLLRASEVKGRSWKEGCVSEHEDKHATGFQTRPEISGSMCLGAFGFTAYQLVGMHLRRWHPCR